MTKIGAPTPPTPKRGAFPTPKEEIESATPYIPEKEENIPGKDETDYPQDTESVSPINTDQKNYSGANVKTPERK